jgi:cell division protein FtsA
MVRERVEKKGYMKHLGGGVVLTGGGALLPGTVELAQEVFDTAARVGQPGNLGGIGSQYQSPEYATAVGLVLYGDEIGAPGLDMKSPESSPGIFHGLKNWIRNFFE